MIRVEFIGIPGSGKSTLHSHIVSNLKNIHDCKFLSDEEAFCLVAKKEVDGIYRTLLNILPGSVAQNLSTRLMNRTLFQFEAQNRFLSLYGESFVAFLSSPQYKKLTKDDRVNLISYYLQLGGVFECIVRGFSGRSVILFDEGFVQKSFMFVSHNSNFQENWPYIREYLENIPLPQIIISVDPPISICQDRMQSRAKGLTVRLRRLGDQSKVDNSLRQAHEHLHEVVGWLRENTNTKIIEVMNESSLEESLGEIVQNIISLSEVFINRTN